MEFHYDKKQDALSIRFDPSPYQKSDEVEEGVIFDYDKNGKIIAIEILDASQKLSPRILKSVTKRIFCCQRTLTRLRSPLIFSKDELKGTGMQNFLHPVSATPWSPPTIRRGGRRLTYWVTGMRASPVSDVGSGFSQTVWPLPATG